ncbi:MAG: HNH endonuclease, partial [Planctomycetales bacterium]|nr:HNH endonuclease [Planctomycetales bacterium]
MRPIRRGQSPLAVDFADFTHAKPDLVGRLGLYCSYCERRVATNLAVEHIQPKSMPAYAHLAGCWNNFLLGCVNCNSSKLTKDVVLANILIPDRDNTFHALQYLEDGTIEPSAAAVAAGLEPKVNATLALTGLDKAALNTPDVNGQQVALDRVRQRMEAWLLAVESLNDIVSNPAVAAMRGSVIRTAIATGFFSIWMTVFQADQDMLNRLV